MDRGDGILKVHGMMAVPLFEACTWHLAGVDLGLLSREVITICMTYLLRTYSVPTPYLVTLAFTCGSLVTLVLMPAVHQMRLVFQNGRARTLQCGTPVPIHY